MAYKQLLKYENNKHSPFGEEDAFDPKFIKINEDADNLLEIVDGGLKATSEIPTGGEDGQVLKSDGQGGLEWAGDAEGITEVEHEDTATVEMSGEGTTAEPLKADVKLSDKDGNILKAETDGLFAAALEVDGADVPEVSEGYDMSTNYVGSRDMTLGGPAGWIEFPAGSGQKIPYYA